jgi:hypothetical protein
MSPLAAAFLSAYEKGIALGGRQKIFSGLVDNMVYDDVTNDIGYGQYQDGFLLLFSDQLDDLQSCLDTWNFLIPADGVSRKVVGRNAYGSLLVIENREANGTASQMGIVDTVTVSYWNNEHCLFANFLGHWLPQKKVLHTFTDNSVYAQWRKNTGASLEPGQILAPKVPLGLGGKMELSNFQPENFKTYFESTAAIYRNVSRPSSLSAEG